MAGVSDIYILRQLCLTGWHVFTYTWTLYRNTSKTSLNAIPISNSTNDPKQICRWQTLYLTEYQYVHMCPNSKSASVREWYISMVVAGSLEAQVIIIILWCVARSGFWGKNVFQLPGSCVHDSGFPGSCVKDPGCWSHDCLASMTTSPTHCDVT